MATTPQQPPTMNHQHHWQKKLLDKKQWRAGFQSIKRIGETALIGGKAGLKYALYQPSQAVLLRETFEALGATYIKLGQFIASSPSFFPREYVEEFQKCLDQTPVLPFSYIQQVLQQEFPQQNIDEIFQFIDPQPLASASIAQVHAATLVTGEDVVIKVQKPDVETILYTDLNVVHWSSRLLERFLPQIKFASLADITDEIRKRMIKEVDFIAEAQNLQDFIDYLAITNNTLITAPKIYHQYSTRRVLTMQRLYGTALTDIEQVKQHYQDPSHILIHIMNTWFGSLMMCKSFHADLHAGNLLLLQDGRVAFIDFGIVGQLKPEVWQACIKFMDALQQMDYQHMAEYMLQMGMTKQNVQIEHLAQDLQRLTAMDFSIDPKSLITQQPSEINDILLDIIAIGEKHGIHFPSDFALLFKQILYFDRFMRILAPFVDVYADQRLTMLYDENHS